MGNAVPTHLVAVVDGRHDLPEEVACLLLRQPLPLADVVVQVPLAGVLHHDDDLAAVLKHCAETGNHRLLGGMLRTKGLLVSTCLLMSRRSPDRLTHCPPHCLCPQFSKTEGVGVPAGTCRSEGDGHCCHPHPTVPPGLLATQPLRPQSTGERALLCQKVTEVCGSLLDRALPRGKATELLAGAAGWPFCMFPLLPTRLRLKPRDGAFSSCLQKATSIFLNSSSQRDSVLANAAYELPIHLLLFRGQKDSGYLTHTSEVAITQAPTTRQHSAMNPSPEEEHGARQVCSQRTRHLSEG